MNTIQEKINHFQAIWWEDAILQIGLAYGMSIDGENAISATKTSLMNTLNNPSNADITNAAFVNEVANDSWYNDIKSGRSKKVEKNNWNIKTCLRERPNVSINGYEKLYWAWSYWFYTGVEIAGVQKILVRKEFMSIPTMEYRDTETGFTYIITEEEIIGPFKYGCYLFMWSLHASGNNKKNYIIPYKQDWSIDLQAQSYEL